MIDQPAHGFAGEADGQLFAENRERLRRRRLVGYALCVALWLLSTVPLVRLSGAEGGGTTTAVVHLGAGLAVALVIRGVYTMTTRRPFWSPWLFVIAAILALASFVIQTGGDEPFRPDGTNKGAAST